MVKYLYSLAASPAQGSAAKAEKDAKKERAKSSKASRKGKAPPRTQVTGETRIERQPNEQTSRSEGRVDSE